LLLQQLSKNRLIYNEITWSQLSDKADNILLNSSITLTNSGIVSMRRQNTDLAVSFLVEGLMVQESVLDGQHRIVMGNSDVLQSFWNGNRAYSLKILKK